MEHLTTDIITRLGDKNPWLNSVAENYGQLTRMSDGAGDTYPVISPAALVDVQGIEWQTMGGGDQKGRATVVVTLAIDCYDDAPSLPARADEWAWWTVPSCCCGLRTSAMKKSATSWVYQPSTWA